MEKRKAELAVEGHRFPDRNRYIARGDRVVASRHEFIKMHRRFPFDLVFQKGGIDIAALLVPDKYRVLFYLDNFVFGRKLGNICGHRREKRLLVNDKHLQQQKIVRYRTKSKK
jgi:hypothetical protein